MLSIVAIIWIILTNIAYLPSAFIAWELGVYDIMTSTILVSIVSSIHHACFDVGICTPILQIAASKLDIFLAYYTLGQCFMFIINYDLVTHKYVIKPQLPDGADANADDATVVHTITQTDLVKHTYADVSMIIYIVVLFFCTTYFENSLYTALIVMGYLVLSTLINTIVYWRIKRRTFRKRFDIPLMVLAFIIAAIGVAIFGFESVIGRPFHGLWHICGASVSFIVLYAASKHLRKTRRTFFSYIFAPCYWTSLS